MNDVCERDLKREVFSWMYLYQLQVKLIENSSKQQLLHLLQNEYLPLLQLNYSLLKNEVSFIQPSIPPYEELVEIRLYFQTEHLLTTYSTELGVVDFLSRFQTIIQDNNIQIETGETITLTPTIQRNEPPVQPQPTQPVVEQEHSHSNIQSNKCRWPELKNVPIDHAVAVISSERPDLKVIKLPYGSIVTLDMRLDRVRVFHRNNVVSNIPQVG